MILKQFEAVDVEDIRALIGHAVREARSIEYKLSLPEATDADKKEFLADVSSFANGVGGDLLFGVAAADGVPKAADGLADINLDATILQLESMIRDGIEPRISGVRIRGLGGFSTGPVLIIRIPKSWAAPHMVTFKGTSRFYIRKDAGKHQMDVNEIRAAFAISESLAEKLNRFRVDRLAKIAGSRSPVQLAAAPTLVLHVLPFASFMAGVQLDAGIIRKAQPAFGPVLSGGWDNHFNIDGLIAVAGGRSGIQGSLGYCQVFRNGIIESVSADAVGRNASRKSIPGTKLEMELIQVVGRYLKALQSLDVPPPAIVAISFLGVAGYQLAVNNRYMSLDPTAIDRDDLILPDVLAEDFTTNVGQLLRPVFDALWNAGGLERCMSYDENGNWISSS